uniref:Uncharacterized protein n=1 Tax=Cacopsylla melanoneura TaxID=428564 RepID=A0A8D8QQU7_9HEMI
MQYAPPENHQDDDESNQNVSEEPHPNPEPYQNVSQEANTHNETEQNLTASMHQTLFRDSKGKDGEGADLEKLYKDLKEKIEKMSKLDKILACLLLATLLCTYLALCCYCCFCRNCSCCESTYDECGGIGGTEDIEITIKNVSRHKNSRHKKLARLRNQYVCNFEKSMDNIVFNVDSKVDPFKRKKNTSPLKLEYLSSKSVDSGSSRHRNKRPFKQRSSSSEQELQCSRAEPQTCCRLDECRRDHQSPNRSVKPHNEAVNNLAGGMNVSRTHLERLMNRSAMMLLYIPHSFYVLFGNRNAAITQDETTNPTRDLHSPVRKCTRGEIDNTKPYKQKPGRTGQY